MARRPCTFKERDLTRALRGVKAAGIEIQRVSIDKAGTIIIEPASDSPRTSDDEVEQELTAFEAINGGKGGT